jgi:hypothetical protein
MIRLVTVIGHGLDLLPHFISHYQNYVDEIQIVCYNSTIHPNISSGVKAIISDYSNVKIVKEIDHVSFDWEKVTDLYNEIKLTHQNDWWVVADIDEFHLYPNDNLQQLISNCERHGWELVRGGFIDRIGPRGTFPHITDHTSIWEQFPIMGFFRYPMSGACPNKVSVMKGHIQLTNGQHYARIDGHTTWRWQGWHHPLIAPIDLYSVQVHHFKWDVTAIDRIKSVADLNKEYSYSNEYMKMYIALEKSNFLIDIRNNDYMLELSYGSNKFNEYKNWNKLIKKIVSI